MNKRFKITIVLLFALFRFISAQSIGGAVTGSTAFCTSHNSGFVSLNGQQGSILFWELSVDSGASWLHLANSNSTQSYNNLQTTTLYRAIVAQAGFPADTSAIGKIVIYPKAVAGVISGAGNFCMDSGSGTLTVAGTQGNIEKWEYSSDGINWLGLFTPLPVITYSSITQSVMLRVIASNVAGCPFDTSGAVTIRIDKASNAGQIFGKDSVCTGEKNVVLELGGQEGNVLNWQRAKVGTSSWTDLNVTNDTLLVNKVDISYLYRVLVKSGVCPTDTGYIHPLVTFPMNFPNAGSDITVKQHEGFRLDGSGKGQPIWIAPDYVAFSNVFNAYVYPEKTGTYTLQLTDVNGCVTTDEILVTVIVPIPNGISPNGDGINDVFVIENINEFPDNKLQIFNKWGKMVYEAAPYKNEFAGKSGKGEELADEVYYYTLDWGNGQSVRKDFILIKH